MIAYAQFFLSSEAITIFNHNVYVLMVLLVGIGIQHQLRSVSDVVYTHYTDFTWIWTFPLDMFPRTFPLPDNSPPLLYGVGHPLPTPLLAYLPICNVKRSTVSGHKIDSG